MKGDLKIRKVHTKSGAIAVQIIRYHNNKRIIVRHIGSAHTNEELTELYSKAEQTLEKLCFQPSLFPIKTLSKKLIHKDYLSLNNVTHKFAYESLKNCCHLCFLNTIDQLYLDLAMMRIIEPTSKLRSLKLLERYFNISHAERTVYRLLPQLVNYKEVIEKAAYKTVSTHFDESFALILYDVTTLYFESHKSDDDLLAKGFSKDDKSKQPQIVIGLLVTSQGFPLMHKVFKGNTFEGHTMLSVVKEFQKRHEKVQPIIVADAAMLSYKNIQTLEAKGYQYIVGARLANATHSFIESIVTNITYEDGATIRLAYPSRNYDIICSYSEKRHKKDKNQFEKQIKKAQMFIKHKEPGKRAKFVKKSKKVKAPYLFDTELEDKTKKLLGIKGYCTNIPESNLSNQQIIRYYHDLWHVEQAFRMSKTDLKTRPIFHHMHEAIKAHILICFMALMMGKFLEIKTGLSLRKIRDIIWNVHEAHIEDELTGEKFILRTNLNDYRKSGLNEVLKPH
jgi:transposase